MSYTENLELEYRDLFLELAEMKASIPQIKHDKELETKLAELKQVINKLPSRNSANLVNEIYSAGRAKRWRCYAGSKGFNQ
jgi:hypothetical protein